MGEPGACMCEDGYHSVTTGAPCTLCTDSDPNSRGDANGGCICN